jgi:hypothetical protein
MIFHWKGLTMKRTPVVVLALAVMVSLLIVSGCGSKNESSSGSSLKTANLETRPIADVKAEADKMNEKQLRDAAGQYKKALAAKEAEVTKMMEQLKQVPITDASSDKAKNLTQNVESIGKSVKALNERKAIYVNKLKAMKADTSGLE